MRRSDDSRHRAKQNTKPAATTRLRIDRPERISGIQLPRRYMRNNVNQAAGMSTTQFSSPLGWLSPGALWFPSAQVGQFEAIEEERILGSSLTAEGAGDEIENRCAVGWGGKGVTRYRAGEPTRFSCSFPKRSLSEACMRWVAMRQRSRRKCRSSNRLISSCSARLEGTSRLDAWWAKEGSAY
jgi:hypothetical protein